MQVSGVARLLESVESAPAPAVVRLDGGPVISGLVAVLPSAFNPPTRAHFHILEAASAAVHARPAAMLTTRNVAKDTLGASHLQRIEMLLRARRTMPGLAVMACNQARIMDQADALAVAFPQAEFAMVVGYDTLVRLFDPVYYTDMEQELARFFDRHRLIATNRAEHGIDEAEAYVATQTAARRDRITLVEIDDHHASLSSTIARGHAAEGLDSHTLLPEVAAYVRSHRLYREG